MSAISVKSYEDSTSFLDLPAELREHIYHDALTTTNSIIIVSHTHGSFKPRYSGTDSRIHNIWVGAGLLASCKHVHQEATPMLYALNEFKLSWRLVCSFLEQIGGSKLFLRAMSVQFGTPSPFETEILWRHRTLYLNPTLRLERLVVTYYPNMHWEIDAKVAAKFLGPFFGWRRAKFADGRAASSILVLKPMFSCESPYTWKEVSNSEDWEARFNTSLRNYLR